MTLPRQPGRPITVLYIIDTRAADPRRSEGISGGAEKQLYSLATLLDRETFHPLVVQLNPNRARRLISGREGAATFSHLPTESLFSPSGVLQLIRLYRLTREAKVDIVHTYFEKSEVMGWIVARLAGSPVWITSRRDLGFKRKSSYRRLFRLSSRDCRGCVAVCSAVKRKAIAEEGFPEEMVTVIHNGIDTSRYRPQVHDGTLRRELGVGENTPVIGMIANFNFEIKGHRHFLSAAAKVIKKVPEAKFVLVGDGILRDRYQDMAEQMGLNGRVHFLGKRNDVPDLLSGLTLSVLPSESEGFSNVLLESMASARPVVATKVGGNPEIVENGKNGLLVPPADADLLADAIVSVLCDSKMAEAMGIRGRQRVEEEYSVKGMIQEHEEYYSALLARYGVRNKQ